MRLIAAVVALFASLASPSAQAQETRDPILVIVDAQSPVTNLSLAELRSIFMGEKRVWPNGQAIRPLNLKLGSPERARFDELVLELDKDSAEKFWIDEETRGRARRPQEASSVLLLQRVVAGSAGAIGYIRQQQYKPGAKVVTIEGKDPSAKDYPLH